MFLILILDILLLLVVKAQQPGIAAPNDTINEIGSIVTFFGDVESTFLKIYHFSHIYKQ